MEIITFGTGERLMRAAMLLSSYDKPSNYSRLILLPIPSTRDGRHITSTEISFSEILLSVGEGTLVVGYGLPPEIRRAIATLGGGVLDLLENEDFLCENANVTAHGALGHILLNFSEDISDISVGIIGYGRIGKSLLRLLLFLGSNVRVYTTRESVATELCEAGVSCETIRENTDWCENKLIINTAPAKLIPERLLEGELSEVKIIDLASGQIFPKLPNITKLASIPDAMYPETAGKIVAKYVAAELSQEAEK